MKTAMARTRGGLASAARTSVVLAAMFVGVGVGGCSHSAAPSTAARAWSDSDQLVLVTTLGWDSSQGTLRAYERAATGWRQVGEDHAVTIGRAGAAWGLGLHPLQSVGPLKREGDGRSPAGIFKIGPAFGYPPTATTGLDYQAMTLSHYCIDVSGSPRYNRIVDALVVGEDAVAGSTEPMRLDLHGRGDQRYRHGFVIEHNVEARPMGGSCIFAHLWKSPTDATSGCTAMDDGSMAALLPWLDRDRQPVFALLPMAEYSRLRSDWKLPTLDKR